MMQQSPYRARGSPYRGRGRGRGRGGFGQPGQLRGAFTGGVWHCDCTPRLPAERFQVKKEGKNKGRHFYTCQLDEDKRCGFFLWNEQAKPREAAAVLSNSRNEPRQADVQEGRLAGRAGPPTTTNKKRTAREAQLDDGDDDFGWDMTGQDEQEIMGIADARTAPTTPRKPVSVGVYATPVTERKAPRKLPWIDTPVTATNSPADASIPSPDSRTTDSARAVVAPVAEAETPSPATRFRDALVSDSAPSLTKEVCAALSTLPSTAIPPDIMSRVRTITTRHDKITQGITLGRDKSWAALKTKDARIAELEHSFAAIQAEKDMLQRLVRNMKAQD